MSGSEKTAQTQDRALFLGKRGVVLSVLPDWSEDQKVDRLVGKIVS